ncbi:MAG TPA: TatD family hydrolase [Actinomycetes bacterium]|nr:TatD family hydrolase [Actinomycetes bacterium]
MAVRSRRDDQDDRAAPPSAPPAPPPLRLPVADSHTHLDLQDAAVAESIAAAAAVRVRPLIQVGVDVASSRWGADLAGTEPEVWATVALHPNEAPRIVAGDPDGWSADPDRSPAGAAGLDAALAEIDALAGLPQVRGVGETGLDYFRTGEAGRPDQERSFRAHIEIAKRRDKALVIHDRDAHADVLRVLADAGAPDRVVFHCFSGDADLAVVCSERGYFMSFAGNVTFPSARPLRGALAVAPLELILVETDAPFLTPVPYRGRRNAPYLVPWTVRAMAEVKAIGEEKLCGALASNGNRVFGLDPLS